jgi:hypothetical protein
MRAKCIFVIYKGKIRKCIVTALHFATGRCMIIRTVKKLSQRLRCLEAWNAWRLGGLEYKSVGRRAF